jgi:hypothetical protein
MSRLLKRALGAIEHHGALLVFPLNNRPQPLALWHVLFPDQPMNWEWSNDGDDQVVQMWHLRRELMESGQIYYGKLFRGRATVLSLSAFEAAWRLTQSHRELGLVGEASEIAELLDFDSPLSTKQLKSGTELMGRDNEARFNSAMKKLWSHLWIAGVGEVDEGAFPSLSHAWTASVLEESCRRGERLSEDLARDLWEDLANGCELLSRISSSGGTKMEQSKPRLRQDQSRVRKKSPR